MPFSTAYQPRYAVYVVRGARHILVGRYGSLARALDCAEYERSKR